MLEVLAQGLESVYFLEHNMALCGRRCFISLTELFNSMYEKLIIIFKIVFDFKTI